jgi:peptidoglycan hydrolase-like protein with peptidoglycan-binding domain
MKLLLAFVASTAMAYPAWAQQPAQPWQQPPHQAAAQQPQQKSQPISAQNLDRDQVRQIQQALTQKGYSPGAADGRWGSHTEHALRDFQNAQGMNGGGNLDQKTLSALDLDASKFGANGSAPSQTASNAAKQSANTVGLGDRGANGKPDLDAFHNAKMGVLDAISAATDDGSNGSKALDVRFGMQNGEPVYFVRTYNADMKTFWQGTVDANSGRVIGNGTTTPESQLSQDQKNKLGALDKAKWSLDDAVDAAEKHSMGDAIDAWVVQGNGKSSYDIMIDKNGSTQDLRVDPTNGQVTSG